MSKDTRPGVPYEEILAKLMQDEAFKAEYEALRPEFEFQKAIIGARIDLELTQAQLAQRVGTTQNIISRLESGEYNPSLDFMHRVAEGLGMELHISLTKPDAYAP